MLGHGVRAVCIAVALSALGGCSCGEARCGNGAREPREQCDGEDLGGGCALFGGGVARCRDDCTIDVSMCERCGDLTASGTEACDGADFRGVTCEALGHAGGDLVCLECGLDASWCRDCGDGRVDTPEDCDGPELLGTTCGDLGFATGLLSCANDCSYDVTACIASNYAIEFDGVDDILYCGSLGLGLPSNAHTWEGWVWVVPAIPEPGTIWSKWTDYPGLATPLLEPSSTVLQLCGGINRLAHTTFATSVELVAPVPGQWHHIAFSWGPDGSGNILAMAVVDGVLVASDNSFIPDYAELYASPLPVLMGNNGCEQGVCQPFAGKLDEVRFWSVARTPEEIADSYRATLAGDEPGLEAYWAFDEGRGQTTLEVVSGTTCQFGEAADDDSADPIWITDVPF